MNTTDFKLGDIVICRRKNGNQKLMRVAEIFEEDIYASMPLDSLNSAAFSRADVRAATDEQKAVLVAYEKAHQDLEDTILALNSTST